jgi:hypothetical protein
LDDEYSSMDIANGHSHLNGTFPISLRRGLLGLQCELIAI